jgi:hypothetical protein
MQEARRDRRASGRWHGSRSACRWDDAYGFSSRVAWVTLLRCWFVCDDAGVLPRAQETHALKRRHALPHAHGMWQRAGNRRQLVPMAHPAGSRSGRCEWAACVRWPRREEALSRANEKLRTELEAALAGSHELEAQLRAEAASAKRNNQSAWKLRQENESLKTAAAAKEEAAELVRDAAPPPTSAPPPPLSFGVLWLPPDSTVTVAACGLTGTARARSTAAAARVVGGRRWRWRRRQRA